MKQGKEILILCLELGMWPNLQTSAQHLSMITKFVSPLMRGLKETASGTAEMNEQDITEEIATQGPGQLDQRPFTKFQK